MRFWVLLFFLPLSLIARKVIPPEFPETIESLWYTGPLLAPSSYVVQGGHFNYEPYIYVTALTGIYENDWKKQKFDNISWNNVLQPILQFGLTKWLDFEIAPILNYNYVDHQAKWTFGDLPVGFDIQLYLPDSTASWIPVVKLVLKETFPTGKYRRLNPKKKQADAGGLGTFATAAGLVFGKLWRFGSIHFLNTRLLLQYTLPAATHLKGFNVYGGGFGTDVRFFPSQNFQADFAIELALNREWVFACDLVGNWFTKSHFKGNRGVDLAGNPAKIGRSIFGIQYSLAPAMEYNWNARLGIIGGCWFTFAGKAALSFWSAVLAVNYYQ